MLTLRGMKKKIQMQTHVNIRDVNLQRNEKKKKMRIDIRYGNLKRIEKENTDADTC